MKSQTNPMILVASSILVAALAAACPGPESRGFTECGPVTCQPGQYCWAGGVCENGCLSDTNCAEDQDCADEGEGFDGAGVCVDGDDPAPGEGEGEGEPPPDALAGCLEACAFFGECGADAGEVAQCRNDCPDLTENQQIAVAQCDDGTCADARSCLAIDCFHDADCADGEQCVGSSCL